MSFKVKYQYALDVYRSIRPMVILTLSSIFIGSSTFTLMESSMNLI